MLKICVIAAIVAVVFASPSNDVNPNYQLLAGQNRFSSALLNSFRKFYPEDSFFFSPHSAYKALLLAYFGSEGRTKKSLEKGLFLSWADDRSAVAEAYKTELAARAERFSSDSVQFNSVDKLYITKEARLKSHILDVFKNNQIELVDFSNPELVRTEINTFVEDLTQNYISELLAPGTVFASMNAVLVNAAFFKGSWKIPFKVENTMWKPFNGVQKRDVQMMETRGNFYHGFLDDEDATFLELPYQDNISMFIYLPNEDSATAVDDLLEKFSAETVEKLSNGGEGQVIVELPRMAIRGEYMLGNILEEMDIDDFSSNLSGFADNIDVKFDDILHKTVIEINEEGTVAAAASGSFARSMPLEFRCDHSFLFTINDRVSNEVLFVGVYRGPQ